MRQIISNLMVRRIQEAAPISKYYQDGFEVVGLVTCAVFFRRLGIKISANVSGYKECWPRTEVSCPKFFRFNSQPIALQAVIDVAWRVY